MIFDTIANWKTYAKTDPWRVAFEFLTTAAPDIADGERQLLGEKVFARIMTYETKPHVAANPESHRRYIDIQVLLSGEELVLWHPLGELPVRVSYNPEKDVEFHSPLTDSEGRQTELLLRPGLFAVFFPHDIHAPQIAVRTTETVKKVVIKLDVTATSL